MSLAFSQIDAFTDQAYAGNPAAVIVLTAARDAVWMQRISREMNLSETAFLVRRPEGFDLRWFTPTVEVDLCGHATLASAHALWESGTLPASETVRFFTRSGELSARREEAWIQLDFPVLLQKAATAPPGLLEALGAQAVYVGRNKFDYLVQVEDEAAVRSLQPRHSELKALPVRGIVVTAKATLPGVDFVSRFFAPGSGVDEDPVTGSAHCCLAPYWAEQLGRADLVGYQASSRGGTVRVRTNGDRVLLLGQAITVIRGELVRE